MLNNQQALKLLVASHEQFYTKYNSIMYLIDLDYNLLSISDYALSIWNYDPIKTGLNIKAGINLLDTRIANYIYPEELQKYIAKVLRDKKFLSLLGINFKREKEHTILIFDYTPMINKDTGDIIAIEIYAHKPILPLNWFKLLLLRNERTNQIINLDTRPQMYDHLLTTREHEILFLLFHIDNYEGIAAFLNVSCDIKISTSAVGKIIRRNLYQKFHVNDINSLKIKASQFNYHKQIPVYIIPVMTITIDLL